MTNRYFSPCIFALSLSLSGCAIKPSAEQTLPVLSVSEREAKLAAFTPWRANGAIALESPEQGKFNASFSWAVNKQGFDIKLFGPLGIQAVQLTQSPDGAQLIDRSGELSAGSAEQLLQDATGFKVPISELQRWAVGLPGNTTDLRRDQFGRLASMVVEENAIKWNVNYSRYTVVGDIDLPKVVNIEGDGIKINLSFKKWVQTKQPDGNGRLRIPGVSS